MIITEVKIHQPVGLLRLITNTDLEGWCLGVDLSAAQQIQGLYRELLVGENPVERERLWRAMRGRAATNRPALPASPAWAYVDVALWDLIGKSLDLPLFRVIGGYRDRLPAVVCGQPQEEIEAVIGEALQAQEGGFPAYKDAYSGSVQEGIHLPKRVREAVGPDMYLMHEGRQRYDQAEALRLGRALQKQDYHWFEDPLPGADTLGLKKLASTLDIPILARPPQPALRSASQMVALQTLDMVKAGVPGSGGITDVLKIARLAEAFGLHCELEPDGRMGGFARAHLMGATANSYFYAVPCAGDREPSPIVTNPVRLDGGYVSVPTGAGLGMRLDWSEVELGTEQTV
jgi:L-alanine-DL-glutamate epimerase-like enolase superfamily enzyme